MNWIILISDFFLFFFRHFVLGSIKEKRGKNRTTKTDKTTSGKTVNSSNTLPFSWNPSPSSSSSSLQFIYLYLTSGAFQHSPHHQSRERKNQSEENHFTNPSLQRESNQILLTTKTLENLIFFYRPSTNFFPQVLIISCLFFPCCSIYYYLKF